MDQHALSWIHYGYDALFARYECRAIVSTNARIKIRYKIHLQTKT